MGFIQIFFVAAFMVLSAEGGLDDFSEPSEAKADYVFYCTDTILCVANEPRVLRDMIAAAGEDMIPVAMEWFKEINEFDFAEDTDEFWDELYAPTKCGNPIEQRKDWFLDWMTRLGEFWMECCKGQDPAEPEGCCKSMGEAEEYFNGVMAEYTEKRVCKSMAEIEAEKMKEEGDGMEMPGELGR